MERGQESASFVSPRGNMHALAPTLRLEASMGKHMSSATLAQCQLLRDQCQLGSALRTAIATLAHIRWVAKL